MTSYLADEQSFEVSPPKRQTLVFCSVYSGFGCVLLLKVPYLKFLKIGVQIVRKQKLSYNLEC